MPNVTHYTLNVAQNGIAFLLREKLSCTMISKSNVSAGTFKSWLLQFKLSISPTYLSELSVNVLLLSLTRGSED